MISAEGLTVTDQVGRIVTFDTVPQRIISLAPGNTEILYALGPDDHIVGVSRTVTIQAALEKPKNRWPKSYRKQIVLTQSGLATGEFRMK